MQLIQHMVQTKSPNTSIDTQLTRLQTCNDVKNKRLHLRWRNQCIHQCSEPHSCCDGILSCYPYNNCIIECSGPSTCHNLQIDFLSGATKLQCDGFNSCKSISMNAVEQYKYDIMTTKIHKPYKPQYEEKFSWYFHKISFELDNIMEFKTDEIILNKHYILAKNVLPNNILYKIMKSYEKCLKLKAENNTEHRQFGTFDYDSKYGVTGHQVTFMDNCIHSDVYKFLKSVCVGMVKYFWEYTMNELKGLNILNDNKHGIMKYISSNWFYDWQKLIGLVNSLESRVIEYILYSDKGNLGYHRDDESNFTLVTMLNDDNSFDGGVSMFKMNKKDENEIQIKLQKNDILLFPSVADHAVSQVTNGERHVLVFEYWNIGRSRTVGRIAPADHVKEMHRKKMARKRAKNRKHWSQLF
eukprot:247775_1